MTSQADEKQNVLSGDVVVVQRNPTSGSGRRRREVDTLVSRLRGEGLQCNVFTDRQELDAFVGSQSPERLRCIVAAGGDGTLASVVNRHPHVPAMMLPQGTENLAARYFSLSRDGGDIANVVMQGNVCSFDTGLISRVPDVPGDEEVEAAESCIVGAGNAATHPPQADFTRFLLMASAGVDAEVATRLALNRTGTISHFTYLKPLVGSFWSYGFDSIRVQSNDADVDFRGTHVIAANLPPYGLGLPFSPDADGTDGLLDVAVLTASGRWGSLRYAGSLFLRRPCREPFVRRFRCRSLTLSPAEVPRTRIPIQADGDPVHDLPCEIRVDPQSMLLVVPRQWQS